MSDPIFIPGNETPVTNNTQVVVSHDIMSNPWISGGLAAIVIVFIFAFLWKKLGLGSPKLHLTNQRKQALRELKTEYIKYSKSHGSKTNQKLYYGTMRIGKIKRIAIIPYSMRLTHKEMDKQKNKEVYVQDKDPKTGNFYLIEIKKYLPSIFNWSRLNDFYLIEESYVPNANNDIVNISTEVGFDIYFGIWISKGKYEMAQIEESMWKFQNELILSALPSWAEKIANASPKTANEGAIANKEAEIEQEKRKRYVKDF